MGWRKIYQERLVSSEEALSHIHDNQRVVLGHASAAPTYLIQEMVRLKDQYHNVEMVQMLGMGNNDYCKKGMEEHFISNVIFVGGNTKKAVAKGRADFTPVHFSQLPKLFKESLKPDVAIIMVSPPDAKGRVSLGVTVDYTKAAAECAKIVIAQVNDQMPFTLGESMIRVEDIDFFVKHSSPLLEVLPGEIGPVEEKIGKNCATLIQDGCTMQLGIGAIPNAVLKSLYDKKDLGIHSEMISDGVMELMEAGIINNSKKVVHRGKTVVSFLLGSHKLYDFADNNEDLLFYPVEYVNNPIIVAQHDRIVSINSCVEIDLMGQVAAESIGYQQISGPGGQLDFIRGASMAEHGISIIALQSTTADGKISKIVPVLNEGATVTTNRVDIDYVVTEYGIAKLRGMTLRQRAASLIQLAHPDFREELKEEFERRFQSRFEDTLEKVCSNNSLYIC